MLTNENGDVFLAHEQPLPLPVEWVEYDQTDRLIYLTFDNGEQKHFAMEMSAQTIENLRRANEITVACVKNKQIISRQNAHFIFKDI